MQVTNGFDAAYNYVRMSKPIPLSDVAFSEVIETMAVVNVYKGGARDWGKGDQLIGWFSVGLGKLTENEKVCFQLCVRGALLYSLPNITSRAG